MGFRSTLISQDYAGRLPLWFREKYAELLLFPSGLMICSRREVKIYTDWNGEIFTDYHKAVLESGFWNEHGVEIVIAVLAEDNFISKVKVTKDSVKYYWMTEDGECDFIWTS